MRHDIEVVIDRLVAGGRPRPAGRSGRAGAEARAGKPDRRQPTTRDAPAAPSTADAQKPTPRAQRRRKAAPKRRRCRSEPTPHRAAARLGRPAPLGPLCLHALRPQLRAAQPAAVQLQQPAGDVPECDGLGELYSFDPDAAGARRRAVVQAGLLRADRPVARHGPLAAAHLSRRGRHDRAQARAGPRARCSTRPGTSSTRRCRTLWLWGTGDEHITFTWRQRPSGHKYGGKFEGIIPELLDKYRNSQSRMQLRQLEKYMQRHAAAPTATGQRLNPQARAVHDHHAQRPRLPSGPRARCRRSAPCRSATRSSSSASWNSTPRGRMIAAEVLKEIRGRLGFLSNVGLDYLTLDRTAPTLSGGESQRIRLAGQIGCGLVGVLYILDEPSIGLHPRDNDRLLDTLTQLARPGQHGGRRRARRRHDAGGRPHHRLRPRPRRARRRGRGHGHADGDRRKPAQPDRQVSSRARSRSKSRRTRRPIGDKWLQDRRRARTTT